MFVSHAIDRTAEDKIGMLRLFYDCIDLSEADSDGWLVHEWLKKAYATERKPISQNSITWLLHLSVNETYVQFSDRNIWSALQHGIRSILNHARFNRTLAQILELSKQDRNFVRQEKVEALGAWLAIRVTNRVILPMVIDAGSFLQMRGFDWTGDELPHATFMQAIPNMYAAWCHAVLDAVEQIGVYMQEELEKSLRHFSMTREAFLSAISHKTSMSRTPGPDDHQDTICSECGEDYTALNSGLVEPMRITVTECVATGHSFDCACQALHHGTGVKIHGSLPDYSGKYDESNQDGELFSEESFFEASVNHFNILPLSDAFTDVAVVMYRAQGRVWIGDYTIGEKLCGTCFLTREGYIDEDGMSADFAPMPRSFEIGRAMY